MARRKSGRARSARRYYDPGANPRPRNHVKENETAKRVIVRINAAQAVTSKLLAAEEKRVRKAQRRLQQQQPEQR